MTIKKKMHIHSPDRTHAQNITEKILGLHSGLGSLLDNDCVPLKSAKTGKGLFFQMPNFQQQQTTTTTQGIQERGKHGSFRGTK